MNTQKTFEAAILAVKEFKPEKALNLLTECIKEKPDWAEAWAVRGSVVHAEGQAFEGILHYEKALEYNDKLHEIWCARGVALVTLGMWDAAEASFNRSNELVPSLEAWTGLGGMFLHLMRLPEAENAFRQGLTLSGTDGSHCNLGLSLLGQRRWAEAWPHYRHRHKHLEPSRAFKLFPQWEGQPGKVALFSEQGFGDEIMVLRYVEAVRKRGNGVVLEVRPQMYRLAKGLGVEVVMRGDPLPQADWHCALLDVPMVLGIEPEASPAYLAPVSEWCHKLPEGFKIGICWESGKRHLIPDSEYIRQQKSISFKALTDVVKGHGKIISLQKEYDGDQRGIHDPMPFVNDFADTAALMAELDLVISVDTSVAHLAGALGKPVWNLVRFNAFWPWSTEWYQSMKIYRQPSLGDWETPLKQIGQDL